MEKRLLLAALLCAFFLSWYSQTVLRPLTTRGVYHQSTPVQETATSPEKKPSRGPILDSAEATVHLTSLELDLEVGESSGAIRRVTLKKFLGVDGAAPIRFGNGLPVLSLNAGSGPISFRLVRAAANRVDLDGVDSKNNHYHLSYSINSDNVSVNVELEQTEIRLINENFKPVISIAWNKGDKLSNRYNPLEAWMLTTQGTGTGQKYVRYLAPFRAEKNVPRGTKLLSLADRYFCLSLKPEGVQLSVALVPSPQETIVAEAKTVSLAAELGAHRWASTVYFGSRDYVYLQKSGFEEAFPIGLLGQIGLALLGMLSWLASITRNYGIAIILFSMLVGFAMAPFTLLSFKSMKKMQELKPQLDRIMAQHKDDPQKANREVFALYKKHRVSPLSGCLPMLLQLPIFIALFKAISHDIELRGKSFLWIADLSLPDRIAQFPFALPILGKDLNVLPIIMAIAMFAQTRMSQRAMPTDATNPIAAMTSGPMMAILFGLMFYQFPSGLVLYWLTNSLMSLVWYRLSR